MVDATLKETYLAIVKDLRVRAYKAGLNELILEDIALIDQCCVELDISKLVSIEREDEFMANCYMKLLDRMPETELLKTAKRGRKRTALERYSFIEETLKSAEFVGRGIKFNIIDDRSDVK